LALEFANLAYCDWLYFNGYAFIVAYMVYVALKSAVIGPNS
jgi:hypothetical protein